MKGLDRFMLWTWAFIVHLALLVGGAILVSEINQRPRVDAMVKGFVIVGKELKRLEGLIEQK